MKSGELHGQVETLPQHTSSRFATFTRSLPLARPAASPGSFPHFPTAQVSPSDAEKVIAAEREKRLRVWRPGVLALNRVSVDERPSAVQFFALYGLGILALNPFAYFTPSPGRFRFARFAG